MREAQEKCVKWPDIDEKTFVRSAQWAYTRNYDTEEPEIILDYSSIGVSPLDQEGSGPKKTHTDREEVLRKPLYSLASYAPPESPKNICWNTKCNYYGTGDHLVMESIQCFVCIEQYETKVCSSCSAVYSDCPRCGPPSAIARTCCQYEHCYYYQHLEASGHTSKQTCLRCRTIYIMKTCSRCGSALSDCPGCAVNLSRWTQSQRVNLIKTFLDERGTKYPTSTPAFLPRKNTEGCEDYTGVFLCHAKLYVLGDKYDVPPLRRLALHRLHATLKEFTLYPSRMNDIATLASYVFDNTAPKDRIRNMITLYYACIVEDASKYDGLKSLIDEIPDFAFGLISKMAERLA